MRVERRSYSRAPWRLVNDAGVEVYWKRPFEHPSLGWTVVTEPVCGNTRAECTEKAMQMLEIAIKRPDV